MRIPGCVEPNRVLFYSAAGALMVRLFTVFMIVPSDKFLT